MEYGYVRRVKFVWEGPSLKRWKIIFYNNRCPIIKINEQSKLTPSA